MPNCKSCGAHIIFIKTTRNNTMPCDVESEPYKASEAGLDKIVLPTGEVIKGTFIKYGTGNPDGYGYRSHFATCKYADEFRKRRKIDT